MKRGELVRYLRMAAFLRIPRGVDWDCDFDEEEADEEEEEGDDEEEERIFFVGCSRAAKRLVISYSGYNPSRFLYSRLKKGLTNCKGDTENDRNISVVAGIGIRASRV